MDILQQQEQEKKLEDLTAAIRQVSWEDFLKVFETEKKKHEQKKEQELAAKVNSHQKYVGHCFKRLDSISNEYEYSKIINKTASKSDYVSVLCFRQKPIIFFTPQSVKTLMPHLGDSCLGSFSLIGTFDVREELLNVFFDKTSGSFLLSHLGPWTEISEEEFNAAMIAHTKKFYDTKSLIQRRVNR